jgi:hypothetical protein
MVGKPHIKTGKMRSDYLNFKFILGKCWCGCGIDLPDIRYKWYLRRYIVNHKNRGKFGKDSAGYKTGITEDKSRGYATIIRRHHPFRDNRNRVYLHRYLKELDLGYYITPEYDVDHINKNTRDNSPENLRTLLKSDHTIYHKTIDMTGRTCILCGIKYEERVESNKRQWYRYKTGYICTACSIRII